MKTAVILSLAGFGFASVIEQRACPGNNCNRQVTGTRAGLPALASRSADCASFQAVVVTPATRYVARGCAYPLLARQSPSRTDPVPTAPSPRPSSSPPAPPSPPARSSPARRPPPRPPSRPTPPPAQTGTHTPRPAAASASPPAPPPSAPRAPPPPSPPSPPAASTWPSRACPGAATSASPTSPPPTAAPASRTWPASAPTSSPSAGPSLPASRRPARTARSRPSSLPRRRVSCVLFRDTGRSELIPGCSLRLLCRCQPGCSHCHSHCLRREGHATNMLNRCYWSNHDLDVQKLGGLDKRRIPYFSVHKLIDTEAWDSQGGTTPFEKRADHLLALVLYN